MTTGANGDQRGHEIVRTRTGVLAIRGRAEGEVMHPGVGPRIESERLYVRQSRLEERLRTPGLERLIVFDVGLGAGSNAVAAWSASEQAPPAAARLHLVSFERDLGALTLALAHGRDFGIEGEAANAVRELLAHGSIETARSSWRLEVGDALEALAREPAPADVIFWDPFSPRVNPGLWTVAAFETVRRRAGDRATLFTYSASTAIRIALLLGGWAVGVGDATGDKTATTAAACRCADLARPLGHGWLARLARPDVPLPRDAPGGFARLLAALPQFAPE